MTCVFAIGDWFVSRNVLSSVSDKRRCLAVRVLSGFRGAMCARYALLDARYAFNFGILSVKLHL